MFFTSFIEDYNGCSFHILLIMRTVGVVSSISILIIIMLSVLIIEEIRCRVRSIVQLISMLLATLVISLEMTIDALLLWLRRLVLAWHMIALVIHKTFFQFLRAQMGAFVVQSTHLWLLLVAYIRHAFWLVKIFNGSFAHIIASCHLDCRLMLRQSLVQLTISSMPPCSLR